MKREDVYKLIDGERSWQDRGFTRPKTDAETSLGEWLIYMETWLDNAKDGVYSLNQTYVLECVRKIAALAVAVMENNETPPRIIREK